MLIDNTEIIIINLETSRLRKEILENKFKELNITNYTFLPAFNGKNANITRNIEINKNFIYDWVPQQDKLMPGEIGNIISHFIAVCYAKMKKLNQVIILEDDIEICDDFVERYNLMMKEIPKNWNHIYLGAIANKLGDKISKYIYKSLPYMGTHSYIIRKAIYNDLIRKLSRMYGQTDFIMSEMIRTNKLNSYSFIPFFTYQNNKFSEVRNENINYSDSIIFYKKNIV